MAIDRKIIDTKKSSQKSLVPSSSSSSSSSSSGGGCLQPSSKSHINELGQKNNQRLRYYLNKIRLVYPTIQSPSQLLEMLLIEYKERMTPQAQGGLFNPANAHLPLIDRLLTKTVVEQNQKKADSSSLDDKCRVMLDAISQYFEKINLHEDSELSALLKAFMFYYFPYHNNLSRSLQFLSEPNQAMRTLLNTDQYIKTLRDEYKEKKDVEKKNAVARLFSNKEIDNKTAIKLLSLPINFASSIPFLNQEEKLELYEISKEKCSGCLTGTIALHLDQKHIDTTYQWALNLFKTGSLSKQEQAMDALSPLIDALSHDQLPPLLTTLLKSGESIWLDKKLPKEKKKNLKPLLKLTAKIISALPDEKQTQSLKKEIELAFTKAVGKNGEQLFDFPEVILWLPLAEQSKKINFITVHIGRYVDRENEKSFYDFLNVLEKIDRNLQMKAINDIVGHILYSPNNILKMRLIEALYKKHNPLIKAIHSKVVRALLQINFAGIDKSAIEVVFLRSESKDQVGLFNKWFVDVNALPLGIELLNQLNKLLDFFIDMTACCDSDEVVRDGSLKLSSIIQRFRVANDPRMNNMLDNFEFAIRHSSNPISSVNADEKKLTHDDVSDALSNTKKSGNRITLYTALKKAGDFGLLDSDLSNALHKKLQFSFLIERTKQEDILEIMLERKKEIVAQLNHFRNLVRFDETVNLPLVERNAICQSICGSHLELQLNNDMLMDSVHLLSKAGIYLRYDQVMQLITTLGSRLSPDSSVREVILLNNTIAELFNQKQAELLVDSYLESGGSVAKIISEYKM